MNAAVLYAPHDLRVEQRPIPTPLDGEVLVRILSVGVCGSDVHYYEHGRIGDFVVKSPLVLGHESSGEIVEVGNGVAQARVGERVAIEPGEPCGRCDQCLAGRYNLCPNIRFHGTPPVDGTLSEFVTVKAALAFNVPDEISDNAAALLEPLSVGIWANRKAGTAAGTSLLIAGAGPIGLVTTMVARALDAKRITVTDVNRDRLSAALASGATEIAVPGTDNIDGEFDAFIDCSGSSAAIAAGVRSVRPAGSVVLVGMGADELRLPLGVIQQRELIITGTFRYANTWPTAIALAASGRVDLDELVTGEFSLAEVEQALTAGRDPRSVKAVVRPSLG
ncbi:MAG: NAD(P)-dependent alcohol dehydrogenase [Actinobacteria bacterium 13_2_20CM_2_66_6]|nr:MAG: NAD(P)-dependent alcohol dehydrogenase [Actinobacteria bacterium 13_2_20CM_2_66_6]